MAILTILGLLVGLVSLACWIFTLVRLFQAGKTLEGVLGICPLIGFILGWVRAKELDHTKVMLIWTVCVVVSILLNIVIASSGAATPALQP
ncbi:MAG TPA: hypothetical protein VF595_09215 [Tepidisphaeraceae bacterium]|jgi:hypothetical protein